jgi:hypothetical protein
MKELNLVIEKQDDQFYNEMLEKIYELSLPLKLSMDRIR